VVCCLEPCRSSHRFAGLFCDWRRGRCSPPLEGCWELLTHTETHYTHLVIQVTNSFALFLLLIIPALPCTVLMVHRGEQVKIASSDRPQELLHFVLHHCTRIIQGTPHTALTLPQSRKCGERWINSSFLIGWPNTKSVPMQRG